MDAKQIEAGFNEWINDLQGFVTRKDRLYSDLDHCIDCNETILNWMGRAYTSGFNEGRDLPHNPQHQDALDVAERLLIRAQIRRKIPTRKSVVEGKPDKIADLLEEAASMIGKLLHERIHL